MELEKILEKFGTGKDFKNLTILWLIEKYGIIDRTNEDGTEDVGFKKYKTIVTRAMADVLKNNETDAERIDEGRLLNFVDSVMVKGVYDKKRHKFDDTFNEKLEDMIKSKGNIGVDTFTTYIVSELYFDREKPYNAASFFEIALKLAEEIENNAAYNLINTAKYFSLLSGIASAADDLAEQGDKEKRKVCAEYIFKALKVKEGISRSREYEGYFMNEAYIIDLNNMAYSMLHLDGSYFKFGENRKLIMKIYDEILPLLTNVTKDKLKAMVISNLGAVQAKYGNYVNAVDYDLQALDLKLSVVIDEARRNLEARLDSRLTLLRTYRNIVVNSSKALLEQQFHYRLKGKENPDIDEISKYVIWIESYAPRAMGLLKEICISARQKGISEKTIESYEKNTVKDIKPALMQTSQYLEDLKDEYTEEISAKLDSFKVTLDTIDKKMGDYVEMYNKKKYHLDLGEIKIKSSRYVLEGDE